MKTMFLARWKIDGKNQQVNNANVRQQLSQYELTCIVSVEIRRK